MRRTPRIFGIACACAIAASPLSALAASAYQEAHMTADDVRVAVDAAGQAQIEHAISVHVVSGALKQIDLNGLEAEAKIDGQAMVTGEQGRAWVARVEAHGEHGLRVMMTEPKGLGRGTYVL